MPKLPKIIRQQKIKAAKPIFIVSPKHCGIFPLTELFLLMPLLTLSALHSVCFLSTELIGTDCRFLRLRIDLGFTVCS